MATVNIPAQDIQVPDPPRPRYILDDGGEPPRRSSGTHLWAIVLSIVLGVLILGAVITFGAIALSRNATSAEVKDVGMIALAAKQSADKAAANTDKLVIEALPKLDQIGKDQKGMADTLCNISASVNSLSKNVGDLAKAQGDMGRTLQDEARKIRGAIYSSHSHTVVTQPPPKPVVVQAPDYSAAIGQAIAEARDAKNAARAAEAAVKAAANKPVIPVEVYQPDKVLTQ